MKHSIKNLFAYTMLLFCIVFMSAKAMASTPDTKVPNFNVIKVKGHVEVTIVQGPVSGISYADDNAGQVEVRQRGYQLTISSTDNLPTKIKVYVNHLWRIEASENTLIKTEDVLTTKYLQILARDRSVVSIHSKTDGLYTVIEGKAELKLMGSTDQHILKLCKEPKLTMDRFAAQTTSVEANSVSVDNSIGK